MPLHVGSRHLFPLSPGLHPCVLLTLLNSPKHWISSRRKEKEQPSKWPSTNVKPFFREEKSLRKGLSIRAILSFTETLKRES